MKDFINRRIWDKDEGLSYFCTICGKYKPEKEFYNRKNSKFGKENRCKIHFTKRDRLEDREGQHLKFNRLTEQDFVEARNLLQKLGYDTTKDVHKQFKERHNLK